jgi:hypothetical protein
MTPADGVAPATSAPHGFDVRGVRVAPNVVLAPMSGITDSAYRSVVKELNPGAVGLVVTEFVSIEALARHNLRTHHMLRYRDAERPLSMQLFGAEPPRMAEAALIAQDLGADIVDVNCGCPVPKVVRKGGGADLMRRPGILREILATLRRSLTIPFTVKIRAGWDDDSRNAAEIAALRAGRDVPPVHPLERFAAIDALLVRLAEELPPRAAFGRGRGLACRMLKSVRGGAALREALTRAPTHADMRALLRRAAETYVEGAPEGVAIAC